MKKIDLSFVHNFLDTFNARKVVKPQRDWKVLLGIFLIMIVSVAAFDASLYNRIADGEMYVSVTRAELNLQSLNTNGLENVVNDFQLKQENITTMKEENLVDPSL